MTLENFIVCHDQQSYDLWKDKNFHILIAGQKEVLINYNQLAYFLKNLSKNIEQHNTLLTFTAWYALAKNDFIDTDFVGIFEYDIDFHSPIDFDLKENTIYGFVQRSLPDNMFLDCVPFFKNMLSEKEKIVSLQKDFWLPTTNLVMPKQFLIDFVDWYMQFIPRIFEHPIHSHFMERAISVFATNNDYKMEFKDILTHKQLCSHGVNL